jgi:hypothetical protein
VIKDLFDIIDIRKDGIIDVNEWQQTFGYVNEGNSKLTLKSNHMAIWENSREYQRIGTVIAKNRKLLKAQLDNICTSEESVASYEELKMVLGNLLRGQFGNIEDDKMKAIVKVGEILKASEGSIGNRYDYVRILSVYKDRHAAP